MSGVIHLNAAGGNGPAPSTYGWNLYVDISTGCDELKLKANASNIELSIIIHTEQR